MRAVKALAAQAGRAIRPMPLPESLTDNHGRRKKRWGMSAKSGYSLWRSQHAQIRMRQGRWKKRLQPATGPGSYAEASPQDLIRKRRRDEMLRAASGLTT